MLRSSAGDNLVQRLAESYGRLVSYQDAGKITEVADGALQCLGEFQTFYRSPSDLQFRLVRQHPSPLLTGLITQHVAGCLGGHSYKGMFNHRRRSVEQMPDLATAMASMGGVSFGASHLVCRMLVPDIGGLDIRQLREVDIVGVALADGVHSTELRAAHANGGEWRLLIEHGDILILRGVSMSRDGVITKIDWSSTLFNQPIGAGDLACPS